jgi:hypothetical protein
MNVSAKESFIKIVWTKDMKNSINTLISNAFFAE